MSTSTPGAGDDRNARRTSAPGAPGDDAARRGVSGVEPGDGSLLDRSVRRDDATPERPGVRAPRPDERG